MSDSEDDWEKQAEDESVLEKSLAKAEEDKKQAAFVGEDAYDSEEERKKADATKKAAALASQADGKKKPKGGPKDLDKLFEDRLKSNKPASSATQQRIDDIKRSNLSEEAKAQQLQIAAEQDITESLFADLNVTANSLTQEKDYVGFGRKVSAVLYEGQTPYNIPVFFKELVRDLSKQIDSKKIKEILDSVTALYNEKVKDEKDKGNKGGPGKAKAQLKAGKQHQNAQLVSTLMGEDEYDDEEEGGAYARAKDDEEYDFM